MADREPKLCPRCGGTYTKYPSLSRRDNETDICPDCGDAEAFEDFGIAEPYAGKPYWKEEN